VAVEGDQLLVVGQQDELSLRHVAQPQVLPIVQVAPLVLLAQGLHASLQAGPLLLDEARRRRLQAHAQLLPRRVDHRRRQDQGAHGFEHGLLGHFRADAR